MAVIGALVLLLSLQPGDGAAARVERAFADLLGADATTSSVAEASAERRRARDELVADGILAVPALLARLDDARFTVRWEAVNALGRLRDPRGLAPLVDRVLSDSDAHVRWRATWALGAVDRAGAARELRAALATRDAAASWRATVALAILAPDASLSPALQAGLRHDEAWIRWEAQYCLGRLGRRAQ